MLSLLRLERQQKICWRIRIFLFSRCYSFGIETINTFIHSRSYPENHTRLLTKMGKSLLGFWPKRPKSHTLWGGTNLYGLYKGVTLPPPSPLGEPERQKWSTVKRCTDTRLVRTPRCYGQFALSLGKESLYIFSKFSPLNTDTSNAPSKWSVLV